MKISAVSFLNSAPLYWGLKAGVYPKGWRVDFDAPSACARKLASGKADAGLIPSIEFARNEDLVLAAPLCVAARREVTSVLLLCGGPLMDIERVLLDPASRTSQALVRILLEKERVPVSEFAEIRQIPKELGPKEAALVIGDRALALPPGLAAAYRIDLAALWHRHTGLPFVFAVWAAPKDKASPQLAEVLSASFAYGRAHLPEIESEFAALLELPAARIHTYLTRYLHYTIDHDETRAMSLFFSLALGKEFPNERLRMPGRAS